MKVTGTDTTLTVSIKIVRTYNHIKQDLDDCTVMVDTLFAQKERYKDLSEDKSDALVISDSLIKNYKAQVSEMTIQKDIYQQESKRSARKVRALKITSISAAVLAAFEAGYIWLLSLRNF